MKVRQLDWHAQMKALEENQAAEEEN